WQVALPAPATRAGELDRHCRLRGSVPLVVDLRRDAAEVVREPGKTAFAKRLDPAGAVTRVVDIAVRDAHDREVDPGCVALCEVDVSANVGDVEAAQPLLGRLLRAWRRNRTARRDGRAQRVPRGGVDDAVRAELAGALEGAQRLGRRLAEVAVVV